jgi:hypothetical protein
MRLTRHPQILEGFAFLLDDLETVRGICLTVRLDAENDGDLSAKIGPLTEGFFGRRARAPPDIDPDDKNLSVPAVCMCYDFGTLVSLTDRQPAGGPHTRQKRKELLCA